MAGLRALLHLLTVAAVAVTVALLYRAAPKVGPVSTAMLAREWPTTPTTVVGVADVFHTAHRTQPADVTCVPSLFVPQLWMVRVHVGRVDTS